MNTLSFQRFTLRQNIPVMVGVFLCLYFSYHALQGHRSFPALLSVHNSIDTRAVELEALRLERGALERRVDMLRPGSLNKDFLEERVRFMLGYRHPDEWFVINSDSQ